MECVQGAPKAVWMKAVHADVVCKHQLSVGAFTKEFLELGLEKYPMPLHGNYAVQGKTHMRASS